jgi:hypothetical protein
MKKSQAGSHKDICPKAIKRNNIKVEKSIESLQNSERKYSPIRETKQESQDDDDDDS